MGRRLKGILKRNEEIIIIFIVYSIVLGWIVLTHSI
jgi:hypothetical protein